MSITRSETINTLLICYATVAGLSVMGIFGQNELTMLRILSIILTTAHVHYGVCVVSSFFYYTDVYSYHFYRFDNCVHISRSALSIYDILNHNAKSKPLSLYLSFD